MPGFPHITFDAILMDTSGNVDAKVLKQLKREVAKWYDVSYHALDVFETQIGGLACTLKKNGSPAMLWTFQVSGSVHVPSASPRTRQVRVGGDLVDK